MGQTFYVPATTAKKPHMIAVYDTEQYQITEDNMYDDNRKMQLWREEIVQKNTRDLFARGAVFSIISLFWGALVGLITWGLCDNFASQGLLLKIIGILMLIALGGSVLLMLMIAITLLYQGICMLLGKYTIEVDKVALLELKSEYEMRRSPFGKSYHRVLVTNQYIHFAKYGTLKSKRELRQDQECYLLVLLTKKPRILEFWECDQYEIKGN